MVGFSKLARIALHLLIQGGRSKDEGFSNKMSKGGVEMYIAKAEPGIFFDGNGKECGEVFSIYVMLTT